MNNAKTQQSLPRFRWMFGRCCGMLLLVLFGAFVALQILQSVTWFAVEFDSERWKDGSNLDRGRMVMSQNFRAHLIGRTEGELLDLLGSTLLMSQKDNGQKNYCYRFRRPFCLSTQVLCVFVENDRVKNVAFTAG